MDYNQRSRGQKSGAGHPARAPRRSVSSRMGLVKRGAPAQQPPRGEYVLVVEGAVLQPDEACTLDDALQMVRTLMAQGLSRKDAVKQVSAQTPYPKNTLYEATLQSDS